MTIQVHIQSGPGDVGTKSRQKVHNRDPEPLCQPRPSLLGKLEVEGGGVQPLTPDQSLEVPWVHLQLRGYQGDQQRYLMRIQLVPNLPEQVSADPVPRFEVRRRLDRNQRLEIAEWIDMGQAHERPELIPSVPQEHIGHRVLLQPGSERIGKYSGDLVAGHEVASANG